ncbi:hypothetical protein AMTRI_Chr11g150610 [Amborella trichopoda]
MKPLLLFCLIVSLHITYGLCNSSTNPERKAYIVYMGDAPTQGLAAAIDIHHDILTSAMGSGEVAKESMIYSYQKSFNAFAARLLPEEAKTLSETEGVVSVFLNSYRKLHTTRSWDFLGLKNSAKRSNMESDMIVALMDTGVQPDLESFNDKGFGPPPPKWKGSCHKFPNFTGCNNKIIGAKYFHLSDDIGPEDQPSPIDTDGHGTHTASTAAGSLVRGASLYGLASGTARGAVPRARLAIYKVCWSLGCSSVDLLAAYDEAIADGVDIISASLGGPSYELFNDPIAIGTFHAMKKGILSVCSAGNDGPTLSTITNVAPWIFTVAASTSERQFKTLVRLGNGRKLEGVSVNTFSPSKKNYPLINGAKAGNGTRNPYLFPSYCDFGTLDPKKVKGKIVYCIDDGGGQDMSVAAAKGFGTIINSASYEDTAFTFMISTAILNNVTSKQVTNYIKSTRSPKAVIYKSHTINVTKAFVASFSSRGPSWLSPNILKPDIAAPGVDILAAFSTLTTVTGNIEDKRISKFNIISGTSMSCPHVSGAAAYVKSFHPTWSPAAIKSALMTTARAMRNKANRNKEFDYGAGLLDPIRAINPGLIYDADEMSYIQFLCKEGINVTNLRHLTGSKWANCSAVPRARGSDGLNYPAMQLQMPDGQDHASGLFWRTVTNVGPPKAVYKARVWAPQGMKVNVRPNTLSFTRVGQKSSFKVMVSGTGLGKRVLLGGYLVWDGAHHSVRSPIIVFQNGYMG